MAQDIGQKLRVTAAVLGTITRKDLALAFRRVNRATSFDVDRAHKWIQGRARPRELGLYEDWAKVVDLGRSGQWIADCVLEDFIQASCTRYHIDRNTLEQRIQGLRRSGMSAKPEPGLSLSGTVISGVPSETGWTEIDVQVDDGRGGDTAEYRFLLRVVANSAPVVALSARTTTWGTSPCSARFARKRSA